MSNIYEKFESNLESLRCRSCGGIGCVLKFDSTNDAILVEDCSDCKNTGVYLKFNNNVARDAFYRVLGVAQLHYAEDYAEDYTEDRSDDDIKTAVDSLMEIDDVVMLADHLTDVKIITVEKYGIVTQNNTLIGVFQTDTCE